MEKMKLLVVEIWANRLMDDVEIMNIGDDLLIEIGDTVDRFHTRLPDDLRLTIKD